jgi:hypothetical protein
MSPLRNELKSAFISARVFLWSVNNIYVEKHLKPSATRRLEGCHNVGTVHSPAIEFLPPLFTIIEVYLKDPRVAGHLFS